MALQFEIKDFLITLGFSLEDGAVGVWQKNYFQHDNYKLKVDIEKEEIIYGDKITLGDKTTSNFKTEENFVVLECINKLLEKGYAPENIILEKDYPLGHKLKGKLDILITDHEGKAYLMIECKTWGSEYEKAAKKTLSNGGQLLSYFQQDKSAQYLSLYSSRFEAGQIQFHYGVIKVEPEFATATNTQEVFEAWNKNFKDNGIFEAESSPYNIVIKSLTKQRLIPLTKDDSSRIFNQFAEILRHNVVSDKPNAFNKLITLLLCKIVDEDRAEAEELHFQWLETDNNISLQKRLNDLYKVGMERYLTKVVTDYSDENVEEIVGLNEAQKDVIKHIITELRLKKNNEFAFKEVFNDPSFEENSRVLREVVELFQPYQVRYNKKQQFLGDFFELLLNTSIKQEAGQFFTPVPIARFIINSIPLKELMINKINKGDSDFLPYVIDYAVGSGHFLTEAMDEIHTQVKELHQSGKYTQPSIKRNLTKWSDDYDWAYDFVYGIEKDYRLVKTAKVSCFLNGDGLARIFNADGLGNFQTDDDYKDKLRQITRGNSKDNQQFEVLIANPPYSVSAFKNTLKNGDKSFDLYNRLTEDSSEIECLFIERAKQLLKDGGYAGIILPSSILSNGGIYEDAREIILKYFKLVAITEFGSGTFMATGTNTVTLFLERRNNADWQKIEHAINAFFTNATDVTCNRIEAPFSKYVAHMYKTISLDDYASFVRQKPNETILKHELFTDYREAFDNSTPVKNLKKKAPFKALTVTEQEAELTRLFLEDVTKTEKEKLLYFILAYPQKTLLIKANPTGKNEDEKEFLGYEFSNRRGHEGIKAYGARTIQQATKLYDESASLNPEKVNTYIYNSFLKKETQVSESLKKNISHQQLIDMLNFERVEFTKSVSLAFKKKVSIKSRWDLLKLKDVASYTTGVVFDKSDVVSEQTQNAVLTASNINLQLAQLDLSSVIYLRHDLRISDNLKLIKNDIFICSSSGSLSHLGKTALIDNNIEYYCGGFCGIIRVKSKIFPKYLFSILNTTEFRNYILTEKGQNINNIKPVSLLDFKIPIPSSEVQAEIVNNLTVLEKKEQLFYEKIKGLEESSKVIYNDSKIKFPLEKIRSYIEIISGSTPSTAKAEYWNGNIPWLSVVDFNNENRLVSTSEKSITDEGLKNSSTKYLEAGDIIISARGTIGALAQLAIPMTFNQSCYGLRGNDKLNNTYLYFALKYEVEQLKANSSGAVFNAITTKTFDSIIIPIPNIQQQQKVVENYLKIEDEILKTQEDIININQQKEAILKKYL